MLYCPARLPLSRSSRLPGGTRKSLSLSAICSCRSLRRATDSIALNFPTLRPFARASVSAHRNDAITERLVTRRVITVKGSSRFLPRDQLGGSSPSALEILNRSAAANSTNTHEFAVGAAHRPDVKALALSACCSTACAEQTHHREQSPQRHPNLRRPWNLGRPEAKPESKRKIAMVARGFEPRTSCM